MHKLSRAIIATNCTNVTKNIVAEHNSSRVIYVVSHIDIEPRFSLTTARIPNDVSSRPPCHPKNIRPCSTMFERSNMVDHVRPWSNMVEHGRPWSNMVNMVEHNNNNKLCLDYPETLVQKIVLN